MSVVNTYDGNVPTYDADEDTWGFELNTALGGQIKPTLDAYATAINANETLAGAALPRAGGTMTGDQILADVGPTSALSVGFRGAPIVNFSDDKTLALTDAGKTQRLTGAVGKTLTIPPAGTVGFPVDTVIPLRNFATATMTIARGSGVELRVAGSATNKNCSLAQQGLGTLLHEATNVWVLSGVGVS